MAVSGKSIIHYTRNFENLKGILSSSGLRLKYCLENVEFKGKNDSLMAFPMVCFCDLPLTLAKEHINKYGGYGIGLSKTWARANKLNPVLYMEYESVITRSLGVLAGKIAQRMRNDNTQQEKTEEEKPADAAQQEKPEEAKAADAAQKEQPEKSAAEQLDALRRSNKAERIAFIRMLAFCKRHMGPLYRSGELVEENYVFYDEREWRFVPDSTTLPKGKPLAILGSKYLEDKDKYNEEIASTMLTFTHDDISYILVESQEDILPTIRCLHDRYADELPITKVQELCTRIVTKQQITNDF